MDNAFVEKMDALREAYGKPMRVTSAYRCPEHPIEAKKTKPGAHASGHAMDIGVHGDEAHKVLELAVAMGFSGIGVAQKGDIASRFIHIDDIENGDGFPRPWVWSY